VVCEECGPVGAAPDRDAAELLGDAHLRDMHDDQEERP